MAAAEKTTLYLRGMSRSVVRAAKAAAAREGVTLAHWISSRIAPGDAPLVQEREAGQDLVSDLAFYEEHRAELERKYPDEYVALIERAVVDHDPSFEALAARVFRKHGPRPVCMPLVGRAVVRVRSPRRAAG